MMKLSNSDLHHGERTVNSLADGIDTLMKQCNIAANIAEAS